MFIFYEDRIQVLHSTYLGTGIVSTLIERSFGWRQTALWVSGIVSDITVLDTTVVALSVFTFGPSDPPVLGTCPVY